MSKIYTPKRAPWAHQATGLTRMHNKEYFALLMAMRTGKTKLTVDNFGEMELVGDVQDFLVWAPGGVYHTWLTAVADHASVDLENRMWVYIWSAKRQGRKDKAYFQAFMNCRDRPRMLIVNIEAISAVDEIYEMCGRFLRQRSSYFAVDESTTIKNDSIRTSRALALRDFAAVRRILTGLIAPKSPLDVFFQFEFLKKGSLGHALFTTFKARYADEIKVCTLPTGILAGKLLKATVTGRVVRDGMTMSVADLSRAELFEELDKRKIWYDRFPKINGYKNETELRDIIAPMSYRVRLEDCYDLPSKMYSMRHVEMTPEQKRIYKELKDNATAELTEMEKTSYVTALSVVSRMLRLHQVLCGHVVDEEGVLREIKENRTDELIRLLREYDGKAIIWCNYDYNVRKVSEALRKEFGENSVSRFWGGNNATREQEEYEFQNDPERLYMVGTQSAGGRGRMWAVANLTVYYSNQNNLEHRSQSEERAQAVGKTTSVGYVDLLVPGTVDERIIYSLRDKIDMAATISGDNWREWLV